MRFRLVVLVCCLLNMVVSLTTPPNPNQLSSDLSGIKQKISQVNMELVQKKKQQQNLTKALHYSEDALNQSGNLLNQIRQKRDMDVAQLQQISGLMKSLIQTTSLTESLVKSSLDETYRQIVQINNAPDSMLAGNNTLERRRTKVYLVRILTQQQSRLNELNQQLQQLTSKNNQLEEEINRLNIKLSQTEQQQTKLKAEQNVSAQIGVDSQKLKELKEQQAQLNNLMQSIILAENKARQNTLVKPGNNKQVASQIKDSNSSNITNKNTSKDNDLNRSFEDNSPFLKRNLVRPMTTSVIKDFGEANEGLKSNGVLFAAKDGDSVFALATGKVMYSGSLPGFGNVVIIDHGDNYMSIYSGVIPRVSRGNQVNIGQLIAAIGAVNTMPLGGMYFELRHLGRPVNPGLIVD
jgi:murein hydrolase activator